VLQQVLKYHKSNTGFSQAPQTLQHANTTPVTTLAVSRHQENKCPLCEVRAGEVTPATTDPTCVRPTWPTHTEADHSAGETMYADLAMRMMRKCRSLPVSGHRRGAPAKSCVEELMMYSDVLQSFRGDGECQRHEPSDQRPAGLLQPLPIPTCKRQSISIDLTTAYQNAIRQ
jgi:hypothetical protein